LVGAGFSQGSEGCTGLTWYAAAAGHQAAIASLPKYELRQLRHTDDGFGGYQYPKVAGS
jgi:hypothetical protein